MVCLENSVDTFEKKICEAFQAQNCKCASGDIYVELDHQRTGISGGITCPDCGKKTQMVSDFFYGMGFDFEKTLHDLRVDSHEIENGPIFQLHIDLEQGKPSFTYYKENEDYGSLKDIPKNSYGDFPLFIYKKQFSKELIQQSRDSALVLGQNKFVQSLLRTGNLIPEKHLIFYALSDWMRAMKDDGGFKDYFSNPHTKGRVKLSRADMYEQVDLALGMIGAVAMRDIFRKAILAFAPHYERVYRIRKVLALSPTDLPRITEMDAKFFTNRPQLERNFGNYIKQYSDEFSHGDIAT